MSTRYQPGKAWTIAVLLALFMLVNFVDKIVVGLVAVPMMHELGLTPVEFGVIAGSFFWLYSIAGVVGGFMANRMKASTLLLVMAVIWSASQFPIAFSTSMTVLIAARVLLGIGEGPAWPVAVHACYKWFPDDKRNLPVSILGQGATLGLLLAGFAIPVVTAHWGWRANFVVLGVTGGVWLVLWLMFGAEGTIGNQPAAQGRAEDGAARLPYARLLADRTVLGNFLLHFVAYWGLALTLTWLPSYLQKGLGYDGVAAGRLFALVVVIGAPINVGLSWWSQRLLAKGASSRSARGVFASVWLMVAGALFCLPMGLDLSSLQKVLVVAVASGLTPLIYSLGPAMLGEVTPNAQRGGILALDNSIASVAGILAPLVTGRLVEVAAGSAGGYEQGFAVSGLLLVVGGAIGLFCLNPEQSARRLAASNREPAPAARRAA